MKFDIYCTLIIDPGMRIFKEKERKKRKIKNKKKLTTKKAKMASQQKKIKNIKATHASIHCDQSQWLKFIYKNSNIYIMV